MTVRTKAGSVNGAVLRGERPVVTAADLTVGYMRHRQRQVVLEHLDLEIASGQFVALLGRNGTGKSTLLRTILGAQPALAGYVHLDGDDVTRLDQREIARRVSAVLTDRPTSTGLRAREVVELGRHPHAGWSGRLRDSDHHAVADALAASGADVHAERRLDELSDGERQRVFVARALAQTTRFMVLDEPTAFLDVVARAELFGLLRGLADEHGLAVLVATHELDEAVRTADTVWVVVDRAVEVASPLDALAPGSPLARVFSVAR